MKLVKKEMIHWMDQKASEEYYIPSILLMEHAAESLCSKMCELISKNQKVLIVCGPGNNGGDGFALARLLRQKQYHVCVYTPVAMERMSVDEAINAKMVRALGIPYEENYDNFLIELKHCDVVVDALFGVGLAREIKGIYAEIIEAMNDSNKIIVSVDIPSGVDGTSGKMLGTAIQAHHTLTLAAYKEGLFLNDGRKACGEISLLDIQVPNELMKKCKGAEVIDEVMIQYMMSKRENYTHKGSYGKALMIGGSMAMHGALTLAAKACLKSGIGTLTLFVPDCISTILASKLEECMLMSAPSHGGCFANEAYDVLKSVINQYDMIIIGNGMGRNDACLKLVELVLESNVPCIIDGDGIYLAAKFQLPTNKEILMTPHVKEMSYLCQCEMKELMTQPFDKMNQYLENYPNLTIVYKDAFTYIQKGQRSYFYYMPNTALAKGGSGDVLCGIVAGMYGQTKAFIQAGCLGVYLHSMCALESSHQNGVDGSQANDLITQLNKILKKIRRN